MYGLVNKGIQGLITDNYGADIWEKVKEQSNVSTDLFLSNEPYPDEITYNLANNAAKVLNISLN